MQKSELTAQLRDFLSQQGEVSSSAAPGLKLLRYCLVELEKDQAPAPAASALPPARDHMLEEFAYGMLAELGLVPEIDGEPVSSWPEAIGQNSDLPEEAISLLAETVQAAENSISVELAQLRDFADAIRTLLDMGAQATPDMLLGQLHEKARYITSIEQGITDRDKQIADADRHTAALNQLIADVADASGMSSTEKLGKLPEHIRKVVRDRDDAGRMYAAQFEAPDDYVVSDDVALISTSWASDAIDLAHAVAGNQAPENRVMAKAASAIILNAPREVEHG